MRVPVAAGELEAQVTFFQVASPSQPVPVPVATPMPVAQAAIQ